MNAVELQEQLIEASAKFVDLNALSSLAKDNSQLSELFIPSVAEGYLNSRHRVMIVGKETRQWGESLAEVRKFSSASDYIGSVMKKHRKTLAMQLPGSKFLQFYHQTRTTLGDASATRDSIIWANLFCLAHNEKSPVRCAEFGAIKKLSIDLFNAQLETLQPKVIFFVTGHGYDRYIKDLGDVKTIQIHESKQLWEFDIKGIRAYRTAHPQWAKGNGYRKQALEMAAAFMTPGSKDSASSVLLC